jgi:hypothetical protein
MSQVEGAGFPGPPPMHSLRGGLDHRRNAGADDFGRSISGVDDGGQIVRALVAPFHPSRYRTPQSVLWQLKGSGSAARPSPGAVLNDDGERSRRPRPDPRSGRPRYPNALRIAQEPSPGRLDGTVLPRPGDAR